MRHPTGAEIAVTDGAAQTVDFGEHAKKTYGDVLPKKPRYALYFMTDDQRSRYEEKKFAYRTMRQQGENG